MSAVALWIAQSRCFIASRRLIGDTSGSLHVASSCLPACVTALWKSSSADCCVALRFSVSLIGPAGQSVEIAARSVQVGLASLALLLSAPLPVVVAAVLFAASLATGALPGEPASAATRSPKPCWR